MTVLRMSGVSVHAGEHTLLDNVSLTVPQGTVHAVVGPSGSGKTTLGLVALGHPRHGMRVTGDVCTDGVLGYLPQHPSAVLDPVRRIGSVLTELAALRHRGRARKAAATAALQAAGLSDSDYFGRFPHQLSGGQQQRAALANTLVIQPRLLVLDEPTTGLDHETSHAILNTLRRLVEAGTAMLLLSHDLHAVRALANQITVLDTGRVAESGDAGATILPEHPPTPVHPARPSTSDAPVLCVRDLTVHAGGKPLIGGINLDLPHGSRTALLGPSGAGKTTLGRALAGLAVPSTGSVRVDGAPLPATISRRSTTELRAVQYVHQDSKSSFDEYRDVLGQLTATAIRLRGLDRHTATDEAVAMLATFGITQYQAQRKPAALSGGQLQRCAVARGLLAHPRVLICDEVTSALDTLGQTRLIRELARTTANTGTALLLIGHRLPVPLDALDQRIWLRDGTISLPDRRTTGEGH